MSTAIAAWIKQGGSYDHGLALLTVHGEANEDTLEFLALGETSVTRELLTRELQCVLDEAIARTEDLAATASTRTYAPITLSKGEEEKTVRDPRNDGYANKELSPEQREVHDGIKRDLKERDYLRHRLELLQSDKDRLRDGLRIVELDEDIQSAYARLDTWTKFGHDPEAGTQIPQATLLDKMKELRNINTYLSRHKTGQRVLSDEKHAAYVTRAEALERELQA